jgi:hypothetical protein
MRVLIHDKKFLDSLELKSHGTKRPSDVYALLWSISLGFDSILGVRGYTPSDVYALSEKIVNISRFLRHSQNIYDKVEMPPRRPDLYPNHALEASVRFQRKVASVEYRLWMEPTKPRKVPPIVITPAEVYDSLQNVIAELQRIKYRLGVERYFDVKDVDEKKNSSDVVQNLEYALRLLPDFSFSRPLVQYPSSSLAKTPNQVFAVTEVILKKLEHLRTLRGIHQIPPEPPKIYGLKPIHAYQKGIEAIEKAQRLKVMMGFAPAQIPTMPFRPITPSEVYELILRLDGIVTIMLRKAGDVDAKEFIYLTSHSVYKKNCMVSYD